MFDTHRTMGARLISFGGWTMPVEYSGISKEHTAVRTAAGLFDVSHMGEFEVQGPQALELLQHVTANDVSRLSDGQAQYSALPTPEGTAVDDLLVYRKSHDRFMLVVNAANAETDLEWIRSHNSFQAEVENTSDSVALLALQGPRAQSILQGLTDYPLHTLRPFRFVDTRVRAIEAIVSRTGYTGEDGFELYFSADESETLWKAILAAGEPAGLVPAGLGARNTLRLEAALLLYGNDLDRSTTLLEAGLGRIAPIERKDFIGARALRDQRAQGLRRKLVGFEMSGREIAREHYPVSIDGGAVGHVTSGAPSITLKRNIGLTYLPTTHTGRGTKFSVSVRGRSCEAVVVATPFYKRRAE